MHIYRCVVRRGLLTTLLVVSGLGSQATWAASIDVQLPWHSRQSVGPTSGDPGGDFIALGAYVTPNPATDPGAVGNTTTVTAFQQGSDSSEATVEIPYLFLQIPAGIDQYGIQIPYDPNFAGSWTLTIKNDLTDNGEVVVQTNNIDGIDAMPFVKSVGLAGSGTDLIVSWTQPESERVSAYAVEIYDLDQGKPVNSEGMDPGQTSYQVPQQFQTGDTLTIGTNYLITVRAIEVADTGGGVLVEVAGSQSSFQFTPVEGAIDAFIPEVDPDGYYNFNVAISTPNEIQFFDPLVAIGYDYVTGAGDPKFASVLLPYVGDNVFDLWLLGRDGKWYDSCFDLLAGDEFDFQSNIDRHGISQFRILGIEASAGLDPADVTAFVTGLSFADTGVFSGQMRPIVADALVNPNTDYEHRGKQVDCPKKGKPGKAKKPKKSKKQATRKGHTR